MLKRSTKSRHSRVAVHADCGGSTKIARGEYIQTCEPIGPAPEIVCTGCNQKISVNDFSWEDTGESIRSYRARLHQGISPAIRFLLSRTFAIGCISIALVSWGIYRYFEHNIAFILLVFSLSSYILGSLLAYFLVGCMNFTDVE